MNLFDLTPDDRYRECCIIVEILNASTTEEIVSVMKNIEKNLPHGFFGLDYFNNEELLSGDYETFDPHKDGVYLLIDNRSNEDPSLLTIEITNSPTRTYHDFDTNSPDGDTIEVTCGYVLTNNQTLEIVKLI